MNPRFLPDTHVVVWWLREPKKLSKEQSRVLAEAVRKLEPLGVSAITLLETAVLFDASRVNFVPPAELLRRIETSPACRIMPFTLEVAMEVAALGRSLRDPGDHRLKPG